MSTAIWGGLPLLGNCFPLLSVTAWAYSCGEEDDALEDSMIWTLEVNDSSLECISTSLLFISREPLACPCAARGLDNCCIALVEDSYSFLVYFECSKLLVLSPPLPGP
ncbi:unnamed protein product [Microthlaspi erraticum]|uniref:Secreted protein n=1 Tax=Microthlaspi erraticum TaxID=1685480 RepID=A0A6D2JJL5_9BRAS|nr:unnamed protein product [Microthlaspi erraticum]